MFKVNNKDNRTTPERRQLRRSDFQETRFYCFWIGNGNIKEDLANICLFTINNRNTKKRCEITSI